MSFETLKVAELRKIAEDFGVEAEELKNKKDIIQLYRMNIKLSEKCSKEREILCNQNIKIMDLDNKPSFLLCDLEEDIEKQNRILELKNEIKKYFACSTISSFKPNFECKRPYLNIIRSILRQQGYTFDCGTTFTKVESGMYKTSTKYKIFRNK